MEARGGEVWGRERGEGGGEEEEEEVEVEGEGEEGEGVGEGSIRAMRAPEKAKLRIINN